MLDTALLPLSLKESRNKIFSMANLLKNFGTTRIVLLHVLGGNNKRKKERVRKQIEEIANKYREIGFQVEMFFKEGSVANTVVNFATEMEVNYIALCWQKKWLIKRTLLGNIDADMIRMTDLPVFIYKKDYYLFKNWDLNKVLYATDFQGTDTKVMPYLKNKDFQADTLYFLHVGSRAPDPDTEKKRREKVDKQLQSLAEECTQAYNRVEKLNVSGNVKNQIVRKAKSRGVDLIVVGKQDKAKGWDQLLGSTAESLPHKANCSIFIVPGMKTRRSVLV